MKVYINKMIYISLNMQSRKWSKTTHINDQNIPNNPFLLQI